MALPDTRASRLYLVGADVTARRRAIAARQVSASRYQSLFETLAMGVVYQSADGQIIACNPAAEHILGMTLAQMRGWPGALRHSHGVD